MTLRTNSFSDVECWSESLSRSCSGVWRWSHSASWSIWVESSDKYLGSINWSRNI